VEDVEELYRGIADCARRFNCAVAGGDTVRAETVLISVALVGESLPAEDGSEPRLLTRSGAKVGDVLAVTGPLGASAAGLALLGSSEPLRCPETASAALVEAHRRPNPRVAAGLALISAGVRCAIDVSDGLVKDVMHICEHSGVRAAIELHRVPFHPAMRDCFEEERRMLFGLMGGEDYELACAGPAPAIAQASEILVAQGEAPLVVIGHVTGAAPGLEPVQVLAPDGAAIGLSWVGWDHFRFRPA
jgi:thiamine-monophosphate kinase